MLQIYIRVRVSNKNEKSVLLTWTPLFHHELPFRVNRDYSDETTSIEVYCAQMALGILLFYKGRLSAAPSREMSVLMK